MGTQLPVSGKIKGPSAVVTTEARESSTLKNAKGKGVCTSWMEESLDAWKNYPPPRNCALKHNDSTTFLGSILNNRRAIFIGSVDFDS